MPTRAGSACTRPGCPGIVRAGVCSTCGPRRAQWRKQEKARPSRQAQGYDSQWEQVRKLALAASPICVRCADRGVTTVAADVHHIVPVKVNPALRLDLGNLMPVCKKCHTALEKEARRVAKARQK